MVRVIKLLLNCLPARMKVKISNVSTNTQVSEPLPGGFLSAAKKPSRIGRVFILPHEKITFGEKSLCGINEECQLEY
jgi:hypothetical protein